MANRRLQDFPDISLGSEDLDRPIDFMRIFASPAPVEIEIGSGKGTFLVNQAQAYPHVNFLGIEYANKIYRYTVDRLGRRALTNVRVIRTDAADLIANFIPDNSITTFHIYYPDPWPKKRHHKRRFFNDSNLDQMLRCLIPGGKIQVATDHCDYFAQIAEVVGRATAEGKVVRADFTPAAGAREGEAVGTNYERKYRKENRPTYALAVAKAE